MHMIMCTLHYEKQILLAQLFLFVTLETHPKRHRTAVLLCSKLKYFKCFKCLLKCRDNVMCAYMCILL